MPGQAHLSRKFTAAALSGLLAWTNLWAAWLDGSTPPLTELTDEPYLVLLERAHELDFSDQAIDLARKQLKQEEKAEKERLKKEEKSLEKQLKGLRADLEDLNKTRSVDNRQHTAARADLHCQIVALEKSLEAKKSERKNGLPVSYDNRQAKLDLIEEWPAQQHAIWNTLESGQARQRRFGDVEDIGIRVVEKGQEQDIQVGRDAVREMRASGLMPPELENEEVNAYIQELSDTIAGYSDLAVPLQVQVLDSEEINAFALPGGYLFINRGLIEKAETESELAGVIAHEIAHVTARHGARLMKKASIANILFQAAQVAAMIFTGGVVGVGTYYALQYGFMGLGMVLNLSLLGVSRDFEQEADQLGVQYAWNAGYDPKGFISFFDKMASEKGYIKSASFFRTHPAFFERIVSTFSEIEFLPPKDDQIVDSTRFHDAKSKLKTIGTRKINPGKRPTLRRKSEECEPETSLPGGTLS